jgi:hypothetical protein
MSDGKSGSGEPPEGLDRARHTELRGRAHHPWVRRSFLGLLLAIAIAALANLVGQASTTTSASRPDATFSVRAPERLRGGLMFQARFTVVAHRAIDAPKLVLSPGWLDGFTLNTIEPGASQEGSRNGDLTLSYNSLTPGERLVVWMEFQVNPTNATHRRQHATLYDGGTPLAQINRTVTVFP